MTTGHSTYLIGIEYKSIHDDSGYFDIHRTCTLLEVVQEIYNMKIHGNSYPSFPAEAEPEILFAWDLCAVEDGDRYFEIMELMLCMAWMDCFEEK